MINKINGRDQVQKVGGKQKCENYCGKFFELHEHWKVTSICLLNEADHDATTGSDHKTLKCLFWSSTRCHKRSHLYPISFKKKLSFIDLNLLLSPQDDDTSVIFYA